MAVSFREKSVRFGALSGRWDTPQADHQRAWHRFSDRCWLLDRDKNKRFHDFGAL